MGAGGPAPSAASAEGGSTSARKVTRESDAAFNSSPKLTEVQEEKLDCSSPRAAPDKLAQDEQPGAE